MKARVTKARIAFGLASFLTLGSVLYADESGITMRGIIRAGVDRNGKVHGEFAKATGLASATSISYKVLLLGKDGKETFVDETATAFKVGQQFRIQIEADTRVYIYVFHEGPDGIRTVLVPDKYDEGRVPVLEQGQTKTIPDDGTYFEVVEPVGTEKLLVYATPTIRPEITPKEAFESQSDKKKQLDIKTEQDKAFSQSKEKAWEAPYTGSDPKELASFNQDKPKFRLRDPRWQPKSTSEEGKIVFVGSKDAQKRPDLFVEIALTSK